MGEDAAVDPRSIPITVDGLRAAWSIIDRTWRATFERARQLPDEALHDHVEGEWSFVETQRHLLFATDVWLRRDAVGDCRQWHHLGMPPDHRTGHPDPEGRLAAWGIDVCATPSVDEILAVRDEYLRFVAALIDDLTPDQLARDTTCNPPWIPRETPVPVRTCFDVVISEEWQHHGFAVRDLVVLEARA